jgi:hypothetical protein
VRSELEREIEDILDNRLEFLSEENKAAGDVPKLQQNIREGRERKREEERGRGAD